MQVCILMGSPRKNGNTAQLLTPFTQTLVEAGAGVETIWLYDKNIAPCCACRTCQQDWTRFGCRYEDDAQEIFDALLSSDLIVLATPIYSWYCTPPMKAALDRMVYGMDKYYGERRGPALWRGKSLALLSTCGYPPEKGGDLWQEGIHRYCKHSQLIFRGALCEHDPGYKAIFMDDEKARRSAQFARQLLNELSAEKEF